LYFALYNTGKEKARLRLKPRMTRGTWKELQLENLRSSITLISESHTHKWIIQHFDLSRGYSFTFQPGPWTVFKLNMEILAEEKGGACRDIDLRRQIFKEVDLKRKILQNAAKRCTCNSPAFHKPARRKKGEVETHGEVKEDNTDDDKWWEEIIDVRSKETGSNNSNSTTKTESDNQTNPWERREKPEKTENNMGEEINESFDRPPLCFDNDLNDFNDDELDEEVANFELDLHHSKF